MIFKFFFAFFGRVAESGAAYHAVVVNFVTVIVGTDKPPSFQEPSSLDVEKHFVNQTITPLTECNMALSDHTGSMAFVAEKHPVVFVVEQNPTKQTSV